MKAETKPADAGGADKPAPKFANVDGKVRSEIVTLDWPIEYDGKIWTQIEVRRMTITEVREFLASIKEDEKDPQFPMFDAPVEVMKALDADDSAKVEAVAERFLPQRYRAKEPAPGSGEVTQQ